MTSTYTLKNHLLHLNGVQVAFKKSPNTSGVMKPTVLVVHDTASPLNESGPIGWLINPKAGASAHFVVARNGTITQLVPTNIKAWHAGKSSYYGTRDVNNFSVGIEIVNPGAMSRRDGDKVFYANSSTSYSQKDYGIQEIDPEFAGRAYWMPYTQEQINAVIGIGQALKATYGIKDVVPHWFISPGRKVDTNPLFPLESVKNNVLFGSRGPVTEPTYTPPPTVESKIEETLKQKDESEPFDAEVTTDLNIRPWPDSPNTFGVIRKGSKLTIARQSKSQKDGAVWFFVSVAGTNVMKRSNPEGSVVEGFVHGSFLRMLT